MEIQMQGGGERPFGAEKRIKRGGRPKDILQEAHESVTRRGKRGINRQSCERKKEAGGTLMGEGGGGGNSIGFGKSERFRNAKAINRKGEANTAGTRGKFE